MEGFHRHRTGMWSLRRRMILDTKTHYLPFSSISILKLLSKTIGLLEKSLSLGGAAKMGGGARWTLTIAARSGRLLLLCI